MCARAHSHTDDSGTPWKPSRAARELGCEGGGAGEAWRGQWTVKPRWSRACARPRLVQGGQTRGREPGGCASVRLSYSRAKRSCRHVRGGRVATLGRGVGRGQGRRSPAGPSAVPARALPTEALRAATRRGGVWVCCGVTRSSAVCQQGGLGQVAEFIRASASLPVGWDACLLGCSVTLNEAKQCVWRPVRRKDSTNLKPRKQSLNIF